MKYYDYIKWSGLLALIMLLMAGMGGLLGAPYEMHRNGAIVATIIALAHGMPAAYRTFLKK